MRALMGLLLIAALAILLMGTAAADYDYLGLDELTDGLPDGAKEVLDGESIGASLDIRGAFARLVEKVRGSLAEVFRGAVGGAAAVMAAAVICSIAGPLAGKARRGWTM